MDAQKSQRLANCIAVLDSIDNDTSVSRKEISDKTGLSLMTVGKLCVLLSDLRILKSHKEEKSDGGRRASLCEYSSSFRLCVIDLSRDVFSVSAFGASGEKPSVFSGATGNDFTFFERLRIFADEAKSFVERSFPHRPPDAVCVIARGQYDAEHDAFLPKNDPLSPAVQLSSVIERLVGTAPLITIDPASAAAASLCCAGAPSSLSVVIGNGISFAPVLPLETVPTANDVSPDGFPMNGETLASLSARPGFPDSDVLAFFLPALKAFYPGRHLEFFLLPSLRRLTATSELRGMINSVLSPSGESSGYSFCPAPEAAVTAGARRLLLCAYIYANI